MKRIKVLDRKYEVPKSLIDYINIITNQDEELKTHLLLDENGLEIPIQTPEALRKTLMRLADILAGYLVSIVSFYDDELSPVDSGFDPDYFLNIRKKVNRHAELIDFLISKKAEEKAINALLDYIEYLIGTYVEIHNKEELEEQKEI